MIIFFVRSILTFALPIPSPPLLLFLSISKQQREGIVVGEQQVTLDFKASEVNDILRSLRVEDDHGGVVSNITYETTKQLIANGYPQFISFIIFKLCSFPLFLHWKSFLIDKRRAPIFIPANNSMATIFNHMQGTYTAFCFSIGDFYLNCTSLGVNVKLEKGEESVSGRVIGLTKKTGLYHYLYSFYHLILLGLFIFDSKIHKKKTRHISK